RAIAAAPTEPRPLSLHDALPISGRRASASPAPRTGAARWPASAAARRAACPWPRSSVAVAQVEIDDVLVELVDPGQAGVALVVRAGEAAVPVAGSTPGPARTCRP